jgi:hypothetical protein
MSVSSAAQAAADVRRRQVEALLGRDVCSVRVAPGAYRSSCAVHDVEVTFADGTVRHFVLKDLGHDALLPEARRVKPAFVLDPVREIEVYRRVLVPFRLESPALVGAVVDEAAQTYRLLLESVAGVPLWQVGEHAVWHQAARWLAAMHAELAAPAPSLAGPARLLRYDDGYYALWLDRARSALQATPAGATVLRAYESVIPRLLALPRTFIHGEFHPSNVLVESGDPARIRPVDWEVAGLAPGLMDLADLAAGKWTTAEREAMERAYREELAGRGADAGDDFARDLDRCRLHKAVQWLAWSDRWTPPREHAQDWMAEALSLCDRLGVRP